MAEEGVKREAASDAGEMTKEGDVPKRAGLLVVWNPELNPSTLWQHAELLDRARRQGGIPYVWWGKLSKSGDEDLEAKRFFEAERLRIRGMLSQLENEGRDFVLYATDFVILYALRVDRVEDGGVFTPGPGEPIPNYARGKRCSAWFKVVDIRPVAQDQFRTLEFLRTVLGFFPHGSDRPGSPPRRYPMEVKGLGVGRHFELPPTEITRMLLVPQDLSEALHQAEGIFSSAPWERLDPDTQEFLARAHASREMRHPCKDFNAQVMLLGKAFEKEWERVLVVLREDGLLGDPAFLAHWKSRGGFDSGRANTIGSCHILLATAREARREGYALPDYLSALVDDKRRVAWIGAFGEWRNEAAHLGVVSEETANHVWEAFKDPLQILRPLTSASARAAFHGGFSMPLLQRPASR